MKHRAPRTGPSLLLRLRRCGLAFLVAGVMPLHAAPPGELEAKIKAAYVFHIIKFVDWPNLPADTLHLCVAGSDGVTLLLGDLAGKQIKDRALKVDNDGSFDPSQCQVLYLGRPDRRWPELQARLRGQAVLTVSDQDGFARGGGIVGLYPEGGKIKLEINPDAARSANLRISAKLLELARTVP
ncbi:MAG: YfiR family protein [Zoogloea sp.]|nr:YfiR family protein [Zoogloea sp.]